MRFRCNGFQNPDNILRKGENLWKFVEVAENAEKKIWIKLLNNKQFYENFNLNFSPQNKKPSTYI